MRTYGRSPVATISSPETFDPSNSGTLNASLSGDDLTYTNNGNAAHSVANVRASVSSGKWYAEFKVTNPQGAFGFDYGAGVGLAAPGFGVNGAALGKSVSFNNLAFFDQGTGVAVWYNNTLEFINAGVHLNTNDIVGIALDLTLGANAISFYVNGTLIHTTNLQGIGLGGLTWFVAVSVANDTGVSAVKANFGATPYAEAPPTGFKNLVVQTPAPPGTMAWVEVDTDAQGLNDAVYLTTLIQNLKLVLGESPFYGDFGIPVEQSVAQQVFPDFYVSLTQQRFSPYFSSLIIVRTDDNPPTYRVNLITNQGFKFTAEVAT